MTDKVILSWTAISTSGHRDVAPLKNQPRRRSKAHMSRKQTVLSPVKIYYAWSAAALNRQIVSQSDALKYGSATIDRVLKHRDCNGWPLTLLLDLDMPLPRVLICSTSLCLLSLFRLFT